MLQMPKYYFSGEFTDFEPLFLRLGGQVQTYEPGEFLARAGEWAGRCFYVRRGVHVLSGVREDGRDSLMLLFGPGSVYPFACQRGDLFQEFFLSSRAVSRVEALVLTREQLAAAVEESGKLALAAIQQHCELEHLLLMQRLFHSGGAPRFKVGSFLYLYDQARPEVGDALYLTQENVASFVDLSRMQVSRVFRELRRLELIQTGRHQIRVTDPEGLRRWCEERMEE